LDVAAFEGAVASWLRGSGLPEREPASLDGKTLRGIHGELLPGVHLVAVYGHESQTVLAQLRTAGKGHELAAGEQLLAAVPLDERVVTGDGLFTQRDLCAQIVAGGGDYVLPVEENQPALRADLVAAFSPLGAGDAGRGGGP
jgi:hypothetical protein